MFVLYSARCRVCTKAVVSRVVIRATRLKVTARAPFHVSLHYLLKRGCDKY